MIHFFTTPNLSITCTLSPNNKKNKEQLQERLNSLTDGRNDRDGIEEGAAKVPLNRAFIALILAAGVTFALGLVDDQFLVSPDHFAGVRSPIISPKDVKFLWKYTVQST